MQTHGRTTTLRINYRNTKQILQTANFIAADLLTADDKDNDGIPLGKLSSCGRENPAADAIQIMTMKFSKGLGFPGATQRLGT